MSTRMTFFFDIVCPYAYLAAERISRLPKELRARIDWQPIHLGGLLAATGGETNPMNIMSAARLRMNALDLTRWSQRLNLPLIMPNSHPMRTTDAMRHLTMLDGAERQRVTRAYFRGYWSSNAPEHWRNVESTARKYLVEDREHDESAARLKQATKAAAELGAFGVPCFVVGEAVFWGQDRLFQALTALTNTAVQEDISLDRFSSAGPPTGIRFFHDFSSPFSYLAATQIRSLCHRLGAKFNPKPILLGALFRNIGTPDVPLFTFSEAKRAYVAKDLTRWAEKWSVPFVFPTQFPIRTVTPLRIALLKPELTETFYRWAWAENHNIGDEDILRALLTAEGYDAEDLLHRVQAPEVKAVLRANTDEARDVGACGVPTFVVDFMHGEQLVWGQDRLCFVEWMLKGWFPSSMEHH